MTALDKTTLVDLDEDELAEIKTTHVNCDGAFTEAELSHLYVKTPPSLPTFHVALCCALLVPPPLLTVGFSCQGMRTTNSMARPSHSKTLQSSSTRSPVPRRGWRTSCSACTIRIGPGLSRLTG